LRLLRRDWNFFPLRLLPLPLPLPLRGGCFIGPVLSTKLNNFPLWIWRAGDLHVPFSRPSRDVTK
jgi:hypothetical protein